MDLMDLFEELKAADARGAVDNYTHVLHLNIVDVRTILQRVADLESWVKKAKYILANNEVLGDVESGQLAEFASKVLKV
jgi:hypothetical protein